ncbi:hypothetical protein ACSSV1_006163 [Labrenzia sp. MBR-25]|jgi:hypothetical protein
MGGQHEYSMVGHSRSRIGLYIALVAGAITSGITVIITWGMAWLKSKGYIDMPSVVFVPLTVTAVFGVLFFLFDRFAWKIFGFKAVVGVPDISGEWKVAGKSYDTDNNPKYDWEGTIHITQQYERISIAQGTNDSGSSSISAAIIPEGIKGYRLIYSYRNDPKPGNKELKKHIGHCELLFAPDLNSADGSYFNGGDRFTLGTMKLERV